MTYLALLVNGVYDSVALLRYSWEVWAQGLEEAHCAGCRARDQGPSN